MVNFDREGPRPRGFSWVPRETRSEKNPVVKISAKFGIPAKNRDVTFTQGLHANVPISNRSGDRGRAKEDKVRSPKLPTDPRQYKLILIL